MLDTSVLINFLAIDQADLLADHPDYRFLITDHVRVEVTEFYPEQFDRLQKLLRQHAFEQIRVDTPEELEIFSRLIAGRRLGAGESAAVAAAIHRGHALAIDDARATRLLLSLSPQTHVETTQSLIVRLIRKGMLTVKQADCFKHEWETVHRFRLRFRSFSELL